MTISQIMEKMIAFSDGNLHDIDHFIRVWTYAKLIGEQEGLDPEKQFILEAAAIMHDIACPLCREKYGNTNGKLQESEGEQLAEVFLVDSGLRREQVERVKYLVGHHHTLTDIDGMDHQILIEADYIANASENGYSDENIRSFLRSVCATPKGAGLIRSIFGVR